ncbi:MAG: hypothetical protein HQK92_13030 [Nitrospirae bacterium]|nr:hypothetical protein [Nitrospirota bacterium]
MRCLKCNGTGNIESFDVGIGENSLLPAYTDISCPVCDGTGEVDDNALNNEYTNVCYKCRGQGTVIDITIGLGAHGLLPAYRKVVCDICGGEGII